MTPARTFSNESEAVSYIFESLRRLRGQQRGPDEDARDPAPTRQLLAAADLLAQPREYAVITGSKGKGSTAAITAKLLQHLGHTVGMMTSPHLASWRERIRVNGRAIPEPDFLRILSDLSPDIDAVAAKLTAQQYFSPQGIFLAIALRWFDEQQVNAAVLEVGRGGRFDDVALVPNRLSLFTPIMLEHTKYLGSTLERIAWHKAGIIKPYSYAYSVLQAPEVLAVLQAEADALEAEFNWIAGIDMWEYVGPAENGIRIRLGRYGEATLSLLGRYQISNASLAVRGAGNVHARLPGIPHGSPEYVEAIRAGLADVKWPGRCQKIQDNPLIYVDGAINAESAELFVESVHDRLTEPVISIIGEPEDKDYQGVYATLGPISQAVILTETTRNPILHFPDPETALAAARQHNPDVTHTRTIAEALELATQRAGRDGAILLVATQSVLADAMVLWGKTFEVI